MYPTAQEKEIIQAAEKMMIDTMARYDPSHDAYHGKYENIARSRGISYLFKRWICCLSVRRVRQTALAIAQNVAPQPDLLVVELGALVLDEVRLALLQHRTLEKRRCYTMS